MMGSSESLLTLSQLRVHEEYIIHDSSEATYLFYSILYWVATRPESELKRSTLTLVSAKFLQMSQASHLGKMFIDLDKHFGNPLRNNGVDLERWVYEQREKPNV
jgi:hypothetical protein